MLWIIILFEVFTVIVFLESLNLIDNLQDFPFLPPIQ